MNFSPAPGANHIYHGCHECVQQRKQQIRFRNDLMTATSKVFFVAGSGAAGARSLNIETNVAIVFTTATICGFLCSTWAAELLGKCFNHCFLRDRCCQHVRKALAEINGNGTVPGHAGTSGDSTNPQTEVLPFIEHDESDVAFISNKKRFQERFADAIKS